jgi:hypothetical protein
MNKCAQCADVEVPNPADLCPSCAEDYEYGEDGMLRFKGLTEVEPEEPEIMLTIELVPTKGYRIRQVNGAFFVRDFAGRVAYWPSLDAAEGFLQRQGVPKHEGAPAGPGN